MRRFHVLICSWKAIPFNVIIFILWPAEEGEYAISGFPSGVCPVDSTRRLKHYEPTNGALDLHRAARRWRPHRFFEGEKPGLAHHVSGFRGGT